MSNIQYHASTSGLVALSSDQPIKGWYRPSRALGVSVLGNAETIMTADEAKAKITELVEAGHNVTRGKDVSATGVATLRSGRSTSGDAREVW